MVIKRRLTLGWILALPAITALACALGAESSTPTPNVPPTSAIKPVVAILSPQNGSTASLGSAITVQVNAQHPEGITRVELSANGQVVDSKVSVNPLGDPQLQANLNYTPITGGTLSLAVIAYRGNQPSDPAVLSVNVGTTAPTATTDTSSDNSSNNSSSSSSNVDTSGPCQARVEVNSLNFRQGPGQNYTSLQVLGLGTIVPITGALPDLSWWQGTYNNTSGWLSRYYITLLGNCYNVPAVNPPASPIPATLTPAPTVQQSTIVTVADLTVLKIDGPTSIVLRPDGTQTAQFTITIQNLGTAAAANFTTEIQLPDGTLQPLGTLATLAPGQSAVFQATVLFTSPGTSRISAIIDRANAVAESDKTNNLRSFDLLVVKPTPAAATAAQ
jgi:uncharacterized repeat protein (TIGR01451 family)